MVKLCAHHQKQFLFVLNSLCTEEPFMNSKSQSACSLDVKDANLEDHNNCVSESTKETVMHSTSIETSISTPAVCADMETCPREVAQNIEILKSHVMLDVGKNSVTEISFLNNCSHSPSHQDENFVKNHILHVKPTEENSQLLQSDETGCTKKFEPLQTDVSDCCVHSHSNLTLTPVTSAQEAEFLINLPKCADKENAQCVSPRQANLDKDSDCKLKQNSVHTVVVTKLGNHLNHFESFQTLNDSNVPPLHKIRSHENIKHSKTAKRCKNTPSLRKSDCDNQCDVVYISEPITAQYHFQHQKSYLCSRNTARKSTRGYLFNDECCQLSTVRTLVRSSRVEDKGNCALHFAEALIIPEGVITETLPLTDVTLVHSEGTCVGIGTGNTLPQSETIPDPCICKESGNTDISGMVEQSVSAVSDSLLAGFSVVHNGNNNPSFSGPHPSHESLQKKPLDMLVDEGNIPLDVRNIHRDLPEKHPSEATCSSLSVNEENHATLTSLNVDLIASLKDETVLSENDNVNEVAANELISMKPTVQQIQVPLENLSVDPSISCSVSPVSNKSETTEIVPTASDFLPCEKMSNPLEDPDLSPAYSYTDANGVKETFEASSNDCLQQDLNSHNRLNYLGGNITKIAIDISSITSAKKTEEEDYIEQQNSDKCTVHVEPTEKLEINETEPSVVINCTTAGNQIDRISTKDVNQLIDTCAKICEPDDLQLQDSSVKNQDVRCPSVASYEVANIGDTEKSSQTKEINGENNSNIIKLDILDSLLPGHDTNDNIPMPSKRKLKKSPAPSDRRLRSRETDACIKKGSLHIQISQFPSTKSFHRSVEFSTECTTQYRHLMHTNSNFEESLDGKNVFAQFLNDQFAEQKALLSDRMFKNTTSSTLKRVENVSIHFEISSEKRKVFFCSKNKNDLKVEEEEINCTPGVLNNSCPFRFKQFNKQVPVDASVSLARTRSKTKCAVLNSPTTEDEGKHNKAKILPQLLAENERQPSKCKKSLAFTNMAISLNRSKEKVRPKFIDWCFEEESQERISTFHNKYSSVHNNWIPLEKDVSIGPKSKNKDKLKEIWKTKKRVRKTKTVEETQKYSPMQMLFKTSFKLSDICRWFLETTETKSLVIVKKLNTRLPEEHQLPVPPLQKHPSPSLYPHMLQAKRLKKHLKKFASVYPACNNASTQNALNKLENMQLVETLKSSVKGASDSKYSEQKVYTDKTTSARILRKYNHFRGKLHHPSVPLSKKSKLSMEQASSVKKENTRRLPSRVNLQTAANPPVCKPVPTDEKQKARKRPKDDHSTKPGVQTSKRRKAETKQEMGENGHSIVKNALPVKRPDHKVERTGSISKSQAAKRQEVKAQVGKAATLKKGKTKTAMQKKPNKTRLAARKCQTRSSKLRLLSPLLSEQRITRVSQPLMKELRRKMCSGPQKAKKAQLVEKRTNRSRTDSSTKSKR